MAELRQESLPYSIPVRTEFNEGIRGRSIQVEEEAIPKDDSKEPYEGTSGSTTTSSSFRASSPPIEWGPKELNQPCPKHGRVGIFQAKPPEKNGPEKRLRAKYVQVLNRQALIEYLKTTRVANDNMLFHIFHVQNARWALEILSKEFDLGKNPAGAEFMKYARYKRQDPGGKPYLVGKSWPLQIDDDTGKRQMYLSFDYLKEYMVTDPFSARPNQGADRMLELQCYDDEGNSAYGYDLAVQRLSVFLQHRSIQYSQTFDVTRHAEGYNEYLDAKTSDLPIHKSKGNADTDAAIIFEESRSHNVHDTLIPARATAEKSWLRLCKNTTHADREVKDDTYFYPKFIRTVLDDIFNHLTRSWETVLDLASEHQTILENKIYDQPADESRARELWANSFQWLRADKLMAQHRNLTKVLKTHADVLTEDVKASAEIKFLSEAPNELERLGKNLESNLVKSTEDLITLLYQSVSIRDSRRSLEFNASMARLSWITFVFLPLTAVASFFGMNTTWVKTGPDIKWYGILASALFGLVFLIWVCIKFIPAKLKRNTIHDRGVYESLFHSLAVENPTLWSRVGPRKNVVPKSRTGKIKWSLIKHWSQPRKTIFRPRSSNEDDSDLDSITRWRTFLIRRWTKQIKVANQNSTGNIEDGSSDNSDTSPSNNVRPTIQSILDTDSAHNSPNVNHIGHASNTLQEPRRSCFGLSSRSRTKIQHGSSPVNYSLSPHGETIIVSEEERADYIAKCGQHGKPWNWSGNRKTGSSRDVGRTHKTIKASSKAQANPSFGHSANRSPPTSAAALTSGLNIISSPSPKPLPPAPPTTPNNVLHSSSSGSEPSLLPFNSATAATTTVSTKPTPQSQMLHHTNGIASKDILGLADFLSQSHLYPDQEDEENADVVVVRDQQAHGTFHHNHDVQRDQEEVEERGHDLSPSSISVSVSPAQRYDADDERDEDQGFDPEDHPDYHSEVQSENQDQVAHPDMYYEPGRTDYII
ncbi:putativelike mg2+ transporter family protein [Phaeomoniella chlamydospora]|uniref:Putativelike mg2+ transporter family protein n=1 Tax=Phaeomoniella chlamydospora TaxID=158046 RepID=A0A0G2GI45_PHACM|nr:putativelike mg2+ transporter family protein [Phaeomoniella chlamydospora]